MSRLDDGIGVFLPPLFSNTSTTKCTVWCSGLLRTSFLTPLKLIAEGSGEDEDADVELRRNAVDSYLGLLETPAVPDLVTFSTAVMKYVVVIHMRCWHDKRSAQCFAVFVSLCHNSCAGYPHEVPASIESDVCIGPGYVT